MKGRTYFLKELLHSNKLLLLLITGWLGFAGFSAWTKFEATPVYMWNMFAVPLPEQNRYTVTALYADGRPVGNPAAWYYFSNMVVLHSMTHYLRLKDSSYVVPEFRTIKRIGALGGLDMDYWTGRLEPDQAAIKAYPAWLKKYIGQSTGRPVATLTLMAYTVAYSDSGSLQLLSSKQLWSQ